jgi:hypothetical protein
MTATSLEEKMKSSLGSQLWRLNNLYTIKDVAGNPIPFSMNWAQSQLYKNMHYFNVILKARQLGFSTFVMMYMLDCCLFNGNQAGGVIADTRENAEDLFDNKIKFAYDNLPDFIKEEVRATTDSARKLEFSNGSSIQVGTGLRGGTFQMLHISEYGKISARFPDKALEIKTGALNTVHSGQKIFVESTAEGTKGEFFDLCKWAMSLSDSGKDLSPMQPKFFFFPWYMCESYKLGENDVKNISIDSDTSAYFKSIPAQLTSGQKAWYVSKKALLNDLIGREFPSTPEEAFEKSSDGYFYTKQMQLLRRNGNIRNIDHDPCYPVSTFWDLGRGSDYMSIIFMQHISNQYRFINYHESNGEGWEFYANLLNSYGYSYKEHYFPHDGDHNLMGKGLMKTKELAQSLGINPIRVVKVTGDVYSDIQTRCKPALVMSHFDEKNCLKLAKHLDEYRKKWNKAGGFWSTEALHDESSHAADAFRTFACGYYGASQDDHWSNEGWEGDAMGVSSSYYNNEYAKMYGANNHV